MKRLISTIYIFTFLIFGITNHTFSQSQIGVWDKVLGPGDPSEYNCQDDSTVIFYYQDSIYTSHYTTFSIPSSYERGIDLGQNGVVGWRGIYQLLSDSSVLRIEGYWHTGLPPVQTPTSFISPTTYYRVSTWIVKNENEIPRSFSLSQNYPNPFNPTTTISFTLPTKSFVSLKIFDLVGRELATIVSEEMSAGSYLRQWNAAKMTSGIYFCRMQAGNFIETKKLVLIKQCQLKLGHY